MHNKLKDILFLVMDCDGVLSDGTMLLRGSEEPAIFFHVRDGLAIRMLHSCGITTAVITGRKNQAMKTRAQFLGMCEVLDDRLDKGTALRELWQKHGFTPEQTAYIGDDIPDIQAFSLVRTSFCPQDSAAEVIEAADFTTNAKGGHGAVREVAELLLKAQGHWEKLMAGHTKIK